tara:strand:- start:1051 stop:1323 length:273 start_codon:yes stop_codon:yes gene_type:complete
MRIRTELSCFLRRKKQTLASFCANMNIKSHDQLCSVLDDLGVEHPGDKETRFLNVEKPKAPAPKKKSFSRSSKKPKGSSFVRKQQALKSE